MKFRKLALALLAFVFVLGFALSVTVKGAVAADKARYVFLMIGDGMALPQRNAAEIYMAASQGQDLKPGIVKLNMSKLPAQGMCTTYSTNSLITDSAAAGTALATGSKTKSGVIAMNAAGEKDLPTIAEMAKAAGMKVGIISTVDIDHATPACFYAHQPTRKNYYEISMEIASSGFDYFAGGDVQKPTGSRKDQPSSIEAIEKAGYKRVTDRASFLALKAGDGRIMAVNPVLDGSKAMPYDMDRTESEITVAEFTQKGIELLDNPRGFFMMVEGGKIDWACHANDAVASIRDTIAFDEAVGVAMSFYNEHPEETLIVVTGDHETGGMTIGFAGTQYDTFFDKLSGQKISYEAFDKVLAEYKKSVDPKNARLEDIMPKIQKFFSLGELKDYELKQLEDSFAQSMMGKEERASDDQTYLLYGGYEPLTISITHILNQKAGLAWTSYAHTGVPVPVSAIGVGADNFNGYYDNTDVFFKMVQAMGVEGLQLASR
ncbi:MAG: alkaline phosphatase [Synergistales bacterium]|nr:alkaline phosphatase [Synergistales bacterium]